MASKYLIVEGKYDQNFFEKLLDFKKMKGVSIKCPRDLKGSYNGKGNCIDLLTGLVPSFHDGSMSKLGLIVDADFEKISSQGFGNTLKSISEKLKNFGYNIYTKPCNYSNGIIFSNSSGLPDIAIWIMPNNKNEGYIEYFLKDLIDDKLSDMIADAEKICSKMAHKKFSDHHLVKSEIAVFMAMQDNPGRNISHMIEKSLLDFDKPQLKVFYSFLNKYFK